MRDMDGGGEGEGVRALSLPNERPESEFSDSPGEVECCDAECVGVFECVDWHGGDRRRGGGEREPPPSQPANRGEGVAEAAASVRRLCLLVLFGGESDLEMSRFGGGVAA